MHTLYPMIKPNRQFFMKVSSLHELHVEEYGNEEGVPVLILQDGPGMGCEPIYRRLFNPEHYRIISFDPRGTGNSLPSSELEDNTTQDLLNDIEAIRKQLHIDKWLVFGAAFGAALALLYAQAHPNLVQGLILVNTFLARAKDLNWFYKEGANLIFPDYWNDFTAHLNSQEQQDILKAYYGHLQGKDDLARMAMAKSWALWNVRCLSKQNQAKLMEQYLEPRFALCFAKIATHYFIHQCFINENQILENMWRIQHLPGYIIHGRYDMLSPFEAAWTLKKHWDNAKLYVIREAGHSIHEPALIDAIILATNETLSAFDI